MTSEKTVVAYAGRTLRESALSVDGIVASDRFDNCLTEWFGVPRISQIEVKMNFEFVLDSLLHLKRKGIINPDTDTILAICADPRDGQLFQAAGLPNVVLSNLTRLEDRQASDDIGYPWLCIDAQDIEQSDDSFDFVFVSAGLHHCRWPHRALAEMYRVARKGIIAFEARDSTLLFLARKMRLVKDYEINKTLRATLEFGGLNGGEIPNYIYRWTEREFEKTIHSLDPTLKQKFLYFYGYKLNAFRLSAPLRAVIYPAMWIVSRIFPRQGNSFGMVALVPSDRKSATWPWLRRKDDGSVSLDKDFVRSLDAKRFDTDI